MNKAPSWIRKGKLFLNEGIYFLIVNEKDDFEEKRIRFNAVSLTEPLIIESFYIDY